MSSRDHALVSIVTPCYNHAEFLERTLLSVRAQDYARIEHIVIDGGSTDGTLQLLRKYEDGLRWISEEDRGQTDAINKGFRMATGDIMAWLNADDLYTPGAVRTVVDFFRTHPEASFVYGDALGIDENARRYGLRVNVQPCDLEKLAHKGDFIVQPAAFWRAELWHELGELDESLTYTMDYDYWMRAAKRVKLHYVPVCLAYERIYGAAKTFGGAVERMEEIAAVATRHGGDGIPERFCAEMAANYLWRGLRSLRAGDGEGFREDWARALRLRPPVPKLALYMGALLLGGYALVPRLRLWSNRLRGRRKPVWPPSVTPS
jgi:hypothetical protein